jgi:hypothetical protein
MIEQVDTNAILKTNAISTDPNMDNDFEPSLDEPDLNEIFSSLEQPQASAAELPENTISGATVQSKPVRTPDALGATNVPIVEVVRAEL